MRFIGNVEKDAQVRAVASGALSTGDTVIVNSNGTVSVVAGTSITEATGTPVQFQSVCTSKGRVVVLMTATLIRFCLYMRITETAMFLQAW